MLVIKSIQKAYEASLEAYKLLISPEPDDAQRQKLSRDAIQCLKEVTGPDMSIHVVRGSYMGQSAKDLQVSILFQVKVRSYQYAEQHISYAVDTSSWKALSEDLNVLGAKFVEANKRTYPYGGSEDQLMKKYRDLVKTIEQESVLQPK